MRLPFQLSRGCTDRCTFCSEWVFWERFRTADASRALDDIERLRDRWEVSAFHFTDSLINGHMPRLRAFAEGLLNRGIKIDWGGFMRANMDRDTAQLLRAAGLSYAYIGIESLSDETLVLMNKRRTKANNLNAVEQLLDAGIRVSVGVIPGFPGDTRERFVTTARVLALLAERYHPKFSFNVEPFVLSPSQPISQDLAAAGLRTTSWPEHIIEIAPSYADICRRVPCTVEGANQGSERVGQFRVLELYARAESTLARATGQEDLPSDRARLIHGHSAVMLLVKKCGRIAGLLCTSAESMELRKLIECHRPGLAVWHSHEFDEKCRQTLALHAWPADQRIMPARSIKEASLEEYVWLPSHILGRRLGKYMVLGNVITEQLLELDPLWIEACRLLQREPIPIAEVLRLLKGAVTSTALQKLNLQGFIQIVPQSYATALRTTRTQHCDRKTP